jgi:hypothetical protein
VNTVKTLASALAALAVFASASTAGANTGGLAGYTGKPNAIAPAGESCNQCHTGGTAPQITINGPASLNAGAEGDYTLVVQTNLARAAGGVAANDGVVLTPGTGFRDSFGEMVQDVPLGVTGGQATFRFKVRAPTTSGSIMLWGVGLAAGNPTSNGGDRAAHATRSIAIVGGTAPKPDAGTGPGTPPGSDGGAPGSATDGGSASTSSGGTSTPGSKSGSGAGPDTDDDVDDDGTPRRGAGAAPGVSCSTSTVARFDAAGLLAFATIAVVRALRVRRRRRSALR